MQEEIQFVDDATARTHILIRMDNIKNQLASMVCRGWEGRDNFTFGRIRLS